jgi:hypothetical protein
MSNPEPIYNIGFPTLKTRLQQRFKSAIVDTALEDYLLTVQSIRFSNSAATVAELFLKFSHCKKEILLSVSSPKLA